MSKWQPIETMPREGVFLVYVPDNFRNAVSGIFIGISSGNSSVIISVDHDDYQVYPSHWMPLPEPPK